MRVEMKREVIDDTWREKMAEKNDYHRGWRKSKKRWRNNYYESKCKT